MAKTRSADLDMLTERAVEVTAVERGSPAAAAGILPGDLIVAVQGRVVESVDDLHRLMSGRPLDRPVALSLVRRGRIVEVEVGLDRLV
jgi:S1-C subfamily serine protease